MLTVLPFLLLFGRGLRVPIPLQYILDELGDGGVGRGGESEEAGSGIEEAGSGIEEAGSGIEGCSEGVVEEARERREGGGRIARRVGEMEVERGDEGRS